MQTNLECIPCFISQSLEAARMVSDDENMHEKVLKKVMQHLQNINFNDSPPMLSRKVHEIIRNEIKSEDPYKKIKEQSNKIAEKYYPKLEKIIQDSDDPLLDSIKLSIAGNVIDFGTKNRFDIQETINTINEKEIDEEAYSYFKKILNKSNNVLYLADNAGETFFDKILINQIKKHTEKITYVVKNNPIINDAIKEDAIYAGINEIAEIIAGDEMQKISAPAIILKYASEDFKKLFFKADMVITKGQGNYESLSNVEREIFFLLMIKCPLVAQDIGYEFAKPVLKVKK